MNKPRQALILIHGIGEQRPMETLRGFVDGVLDQPPSTSQTEARYYSKPEFLSDNFELRRLVSAGGRDDRTDFYEFYWAHLMPTAAWNKLAGWYWVLMFRRLRDVPRRLVPVWGISWATALLVVGLGLWSSVQYLLGHAVVPTPAAKAPWFLLAVLGFLSALVRSYAGDAAVYFSPAPANIEARQKIRAAGLDLLENVMSSGRYDRIIVVGHSLGSVIGYDVLNLAWQKHFDAVRDQLSAAWARGERPRVEDAAIRAAEAVAKRLRDNSDTSPATLERLAGEWRVVSRAVAEEQARNGFAWPVTDFVTLGSPLTYADMLLARNTVDFTRRTQERELPHCPPARELTGRFSFSHRDVDDKGGEQRATVLHSAAMFAVTGWTNLYFRSFAILYGDFVGGRVSPLFWAGVRDVRVKTRIWGGFLAHTHYWQRDTRDGDPAVAPLPQLRSALDLKRRKAWPPGATAPGDGEAGPTNRVE
ncbi:hypothetical protein WBP07_29655 [Novosphingobium sp. BL-8A]|uniref:hypothetical protein n=1 Tax=Novosphingobium sp. BL-8A TaxID=3127639 RepID=UPI003756AD27